ncbi:231R [Invertebrate iridescent virus 6]|uniref:231R n=1 Tax=Invertebrate iridescent virus 6 TaxID=176652 RepID=Q91FU1_IIV6|nr:231R [Invertebrate iridescent virus 6]AAK82092.1 231R [Invertebrate iridescent virus 6]QMS79671.1 hypothetical protein IIV6-T1_231 [Invertebrate iridescent virus 6]
MYFNNTIELSINVGSPKPYSTRKTTSTSKLTLSIVSLTYKLLVKR